jgi:exopolysaccharide biosynthesis polyprenyl glycosylphosphotransferase
MFKRGSIRFGLISMMLDVGLTLLALQTAVTIRPSLSTLPFLVPVDSITIDPVIYLIVPIVWLTSFFLVSLYDPRRSQRLILNLQDLLFGIAIAALLFAGILYLQFREFSRWLLVIFILLTASFLLTWRLIHFVLRRNGRWPVVKRRVLIVGTGEVSQHVAEMLQQSAWMGLECVGHLADGSAERGGPAAVVGELAQARDLVQARKIDDLIIALPQQDYGKINQVVMAVRDLPIQVRVIPDYFNLTLYRATVEDFGGMPLINLREPALNDVQRLIKRLFDLSIGGLLLLLSTPVALLVALLVRLDSEGPVLLRQPRLGEKGKLFNMYKFRTMYQDADKAAALGVVESDEGTFKRLDDPRVTRVGRFLRRTSLDELPQFINVLKGEMSLVGPRPELPWIAARYEPWQHKRLAVPQGMTGWWQIHGRSAKPIHLKTADDLFYVQNYSFWMDIYILLKTPWVIFTGKGAF